MSSDHRIFYRSDLRKIKNSCVNYMLTIFFQNGSNEIALSLAYIVHSLNAKWFLNQTLNKKYTSVSILT